MNKPDKNFRLSKTAKRMASTIVDNNSRRQFIRLMIDGELEAKKAPPRQEKGRKKDTPTE
jgi:hypothetical protein